jgi:hypothetical protein
MNPHYLRRAREHLAEPTFPENNWRVRHTKASEAW